MMNRWIAPLVTLGSLLFARTGYADDKVLAITLFERAKDLERAGNLAEACPVFEASYRADPQLGALLNLANCHESAGQTASAWAEFRDALELATRRRDDRAAYARARIANLEPRLVRLLVVAPATRPPELIVKRDDTDVTALLGVEVVVDPGPHVLAVSAPGFEPWTESVQATTEGALETIAIPALRPREVPGTNTAPPTTVVKTTPTSARIVTPQPTPSSSSHRRSWAVGIGAVGLATTAVGLGLGVHAYRSWNASRDPSHCDSANVCTVEGANEIATARQAATASTWLVASGGALLATAAIVWWTAPRKESAPRITPVIDPSAPGVVVSGHF